MAIITEDRDQNDIEFKFRTPSKKSRLLNQIKKVLKKESKANNDLYLGGKFK